MSIIKESVCVIGSVSGGFWADYMKKRLEDISNKQEWAGFVEYIMYMQNRRRLLITNFLAGMMRGMGFAVGFSILGAVVIMLIQRLALANLPGIGAFFAEVVKMVELKLR